MCVCACVCVHVCVCVCACVVRVITQKGACGGECVWGVFVCM